MQRNAFKQQFDILLGKHLDQKIAQTQPYLFCVDLEEMVSFLRPYSTAGKRIRPYLVYLIYKISGGKDDNLAMQAGIVNELIHLFALVHDDITDHGLIRHHLPTYHIQIENIVHDQTQGVNLGIMIGDILISRGYEHLHQLPLDPKTKQCYFDMLNTTIYGQIQDLYLSHTTTLYPAEIIEQKDHAKSGNYTFMRPMLIGGYMAGQTSMNYIEQLGSTLGLAYQMRDDLLDIIDGHGDKTAFSDHQEGNQTFLFAHAYAHATDDQKVYLKQTRGHACDEATRKKLLTIYEETESLSRATTQINEKLIQSKSLLQQRIADSTSMCDQTYTPHLTEIIDYLFIESK